MQFYHCRTIFGMAHQTDNSHLPDQYCNDKMCYILPWKPLIIVVFMMITQRRKTSSSQQDECSCVQVKTWWTAKQETSSKTGVMLYNRRKSYHYGQRRIGEGGGKDGRLVFSSARLDPCPELKDNSPKSFQEPGGIIDQHSLQAWEPWLGFCNE